MKAKRIRTLGLVTMISLISISCMLFQADRGVPDEASAPPESESVQEEQEQQEEPESPPEADAPEEVAGEMISQWAISATASSSYGDPDWGPMQATGAPDTEGCVDEPTAWASAESSGVDWLELLYEKPVYPKKIRIVQTHSPNQVTEVALLGMDGEYRTVYVRDPEVMECPFTLTLSLSDTDYQAIGVRLTIDQSILDPTSWNEIDAVELSGRYVGGEASNMPPVDSPPAGEVPTGDFELPDMSPSNVAPGNFYYEVIGADEDRTVEQGVLQYQSTSDEYVIGLISEDFRYSLSLILPMNLNPGPLPLIPYNSGSFSKGPTTAIYIGVHLFEADAGLIMFDKVGDTITGSFVFAAHDGDDPTRMIAVTGVFNQIPLVEK